MDAGVRFFVGIDPGKGGGLAVVDHLGTVVGTRKMPETERDLLDYLQGMTAEHPCAVRAMLERVSASPQMGVTSAFTFGKGFGGLLMALTAARMPFDLVTPQTWQQAMGCRTGGDKNISKRRAQQLFHSLTVTHAIADALLLAEYCRRYWRVGDPRNKRTDGKKGTSDAGDEEAHGEGDRAGTEKEREFRIGETIRVPHRFVREAETGSTRAATPGNRADPKRRAR